MTMGWGAAWRHSRAKLVKQSLRWAATLQRDAPPFWPFDRAPRLPDCRHRRPKVEMERKH